MTRARKGSGDVMRRGTAALLALPALLLGLAVPAAALPPESADLNSFVTDGPVHAIAPAAGRTYVGGEFTRVGRRSGSGAVLEAGGSPMAWPEAVGGDVVGGDVKAVVSDGAGGWYIGGDFTAVGKQRHLGLAHIKPDGSVDSGFNPAVTGAFGAGGMVNALAFSPASKTLYAGGRFAGVEGAAAAHVNLAAFNAQTGTVIEEFAPGTFCAEPVQPTCSPDVHSLALADVPLPVDGTTGDVDQPLLVVGGGFARIGPDFSSAKDVDGAAALWGVGSVAASGDANTGELVMGSANAWSPELTTASAPAVDAFAVQAGPPKPSSSTEVALAVYVGGSRVAKSGDSVRPFALAFRMTITKSTRVATSFAITKWNALPAGCTDCAVRAMELDPASEAVPYLYFGGDFSAVGTNAAPAERLARIKAVPDPTQTTFEDSATPLGTGASAAVRALVRSASAPNGLLVGGDFEQRVLLLDRTSGAPLAGWTSPAPDSGVHAVATDPSTSAVYSGGAFRSLASVPRMGLAAFDSSGALLDWAPGVQAGSDGRPHVHALAASGSGVYVGGRFHAISGVPRENLAGVGLDGAVDGLAPGVSRATGAADVSSLALLGSQLYVGGAFDRVGGEPRDNVAAVDLATGRASGWNPRAIGDDAEVRAILPACDAIYVGGLFREVAGAARENVAALSPANGAALPWNPDADGRVLALSRSGSTIYAGGTFAHIGGTERQKVAGLDAVDGRATAFNAGIDGSAVGAIAVGEGAVYLGGSFEGSRGKPHPNLVAVDSQGVPLPWNPSVGGRVNAVAVAGAGVLAGGRFEQAGAAAARGLAAFGAGAAPPAGAGDCGSSGGSVPPGGSAPDAVHVPAPAPRVTPRPARLISGVIVRPFRVRRDARRVTVGFRLARALRARIRFDRRVSVRCRGARRAPRRCWRWARFSHVVVRGRRGLNRVAFTRLRVARRRLALGRYRITVLPASRPLSAAGPATYLRVIAAQSPRRRFRAGSR